MYSILATESNKDKYALFILPINIDNYLTLEKGKTSRQILHNVKICSMFFIFVNQDFPKLILKFTRF